MAGTLRRKRQGGTLYAIVYILHILDKWDDLGYL